MVFLPALLQATEAETQRELTTLSVRQAGLGLPDLTLSAPDCFAASEARTELLAHSLCKGTALDINMHVKHASEQHRLDRKARQEAEELVFTRLSAKADSAAQRQMLRAKETGTWLTTTPDRLNGTELLADEFQDSLRLRLGLALLNLPDRCDGCGQRFSVGHVSPARREVLCFSATMTWRRSGTTSAPRRSPQLPSPTNP
jgi:hypothetical protein